MDKKSESGIIGHDGKMRMPMDRLNAFFAEHKGQRVIAVFTAVAPGSTDAQQGYYYGYVVPTITEAFEKQGQRMNDDYTDRFLIQEYPCALKKSDGRDITYGRELDKKQMADFLEWLKQYAAENFAVYIEDPRTI